MIYLDKDTRLDNDERCYIYQTRHVKKESKEEYWVNECYPSTLESALMTYRDRMSRKRSAGSEGQTVAEYIKQLQEADADFIKKLRVLFEKNHMEGGKPCS